MREFGDRWMAEGEIENIRQWESKNTLDSTLSNNYGSCLEFFVQNELVYASSWTSYGNPREYTLFPSLQELLFNCPHKIMEELQKVKDAYHLDLPFSAQKNAKHNKKEAQHHAKRRDAGLLT